MIDYIEKTPSANEYNTLTSSVGWGVTESGIVEKALANSLYTVCAFDGEKIVGFGRLIGDGTMFLYVQDIMVLPEYQGRRIGTEIMERIVKKILEYKQVYGDLRAYLGASAGKDDFYKKFGFITREEAGLGAGMVLL